MSIDTAAHRASLFHDRALCELLEASAQPGMGQEVKKVLKSAVEKRVAELAREIAKGSGVVLPTEEVSLFSTLPHPGP